MPKKSNQKLKLLYIYNLFNEKTDENNTVTVNDIIAYLNTFGISAERKSVYDDIEALKSFGLDIEKRKTKTHDYYLASRDFELSEIKMLIDSVQSSKFITHKKSLELIKKLQTLSSDSQAKELHRQVFVFDRVKSVNESILYSVDRIHNAILHNKKISFKYWNWAVPKERVYKKNGDLIIVNPTALTIDNDNYYLISYNSKHNDFIHYRVDRMESVDILDIDSEAPEESFNPAVYIRSIFSMFGGEVIDVKVRFNNSVVGAVIDRFSTDVFMRKDGDNHFIAHLKVSVSPTFLMWILGFEDAAKILSPERVIDELYNLGYNTLKQYEE